MRPQATRGGEMKKTILLVEDNEANSTLVRDILTYYGYEVVVAVNGEEGVKLATELIPDLIIMDIQMPVMNGFAAMALIKANPETKDIKLLVMTSFAMADDRERMLASGADGYLSKPINTRELPGLIGALLGD
jgi:two-component system cell cycle response regulator DivK